MQVRLINTLLVLCVCLAISSICFAIAAAASSICRRKGNLQWLASILFGSAMCAGFLAMFVQTRLPASHVSGTIAFVDVHRAGKGYRTEVLLQTANGQELLAYAHGRSLFFRLGERVDISYHEQSGVIVQARFIGVDGREEGVFNSTDSWAAGVGVLVGLLLVGMAYKKYKRDPKGSEESWGERKAPLNSVDKGSLLHLSDNHHD